MNKRFRLQLTMILIVFSLVISFIIALFDYNRLMEKIRLGHDTKIEMAEDTIINSLHTIDKVYSFTDQTTAEKMEQYSEEMLAMYEEEPQFEKWDFAALQEQFDMEIYIINAENTVEYSSFKKDIGLNFNECCITLAKLLDERREDAKFSHDGMDIQQVTGQIKKFSYMPTPDKEYIFELGFSLKEDEVFKRFNFLETISLLEEKYDTINSINVYHPGGLVLGYTGSEGKSKEIRDDMRDVFLQAVRSGETKEKVEKSDDGQVTYRYIPYTAEEKRGLSTDRVVEIVYNEAELEGVLAFYRSEFMWQLFVIFIAVVGLSFFIARLVARPIHLAFHDSLTGLKNRAAFEDEITKSLLKNNNLVALMMIDIDNFKLVNDKLGHAEGDRILKQTAKIIQQEVGERSVAARVGGDEFVSVFSNIGESELKEIAEKLIDKINDEYTLLQNKELIDISISVGVAYAVDGEKIETLYDKADKALYMSKENGKNQYTIYEPGI